MYPVKRVTKSPINMSRKVWEADDGYTSEKLK